MKKKYMTAPCAGKISCPFRKDCLPGWLGKNRVEEILQAETFVCHKTTRKTDEELKQCAGHILLTKENNLFYRILSSMKEIKSISGKNLIFDTEEDMINHHSTKK